MALIPTVFLLLCLHWCFGVKNNPLTEKCCSLGAALGVDGKDCRRNQAAIPGVSEADQKLCKSVLQFCCDRERLLLDCKLGVVFAKTYHHCMLDNSTKGCSGQAETCCSACLLAESFAGARLECQMAGNSDSSLNQVFQNCCVQNTVPESEDDKDYDSYEEESTRNLCEMLPGQLCAHICVPTPNSFYCKCREGYILMEDQKTCQLDKAKLGRAINPVPLNIVPNPEKPVPLKRPPNPPLFKGKCEEGNPCEQECSNTATGLACSCRPGYELHRDRIHCKDVNECLDNIHVCDPTLEICENEVGGYRCEARTLSTTPKYPSTTILDRTSTNRATIISAPPATTSTEKIQTKICLEGYELVQYTCIDIDECDTLKHPEVCEPNEQCTNTQGSYECRCGRGYHKETSKGPCVDVNECQLKLHHCQPEQRCDNTVGSYQCHRISGCGTGYTLNANTGLCEDDDECTLGTHDCHYTPYLCRNTLGSFRCDIPRCSGGNCSKTSHCPKGYQEHPTTGRCHDVDECQLKTDNCSRTTEFCVNRRGGFECKKFQECPKGYQSTAQGCVDVDECALGTHNCDRNTSECRNHPGGFMCHCFPGYQKVSSNLCQDLDECRHYGCPPSADCENVPGSYRCTCKRGFLQSGPNNCIDEDECSTTPGICEHQCHNGYGSYRCSCLSGYHLHENNRTCEDNDECTSFSNFRAGKLCHGDCMNVPGSYQCTCPPGYTLGGDGRTCQDIDECARNPCRGPDEVCLNTGGSYACNSIACPPGYLKDYVQRNRCRQTACRESVQECMQKPTTLSYNFITFVSMLPIPPSGHLDLFALRGPPTAGTEAHFDLAFKNVQAPPNIPAASMDYFHLRNPGWDQAVIALRRPIPGPQQIELELTANLYHNGIYSGKALAKLFIHVSQYEY